MLVWWWRFPMCEGAAAQDMPNELLQLLLPHFQQAMRMQFRLQQLGAELVRLLLTVQAGIRMPDA